MTEITLKRTGLRSLYFNGELLSHSDSQQSQGPCESRWWSLRLYAAGERYVLAVSYRTRWQGEHDIDRVTVSNSPDEIEKWLLDYPYMEGVSGYPPGHDDRQAYLEKSLKQCWEAAVSELLAALGPEKLE